MQATQSNNASDFFESDSIGPRDLHPVNGRVRDLPSPFSAPIQAARKYLERQRGVILHTDNGGSLAGGTERHPVQEQVAREQITREQDRRLERSLYEGNSIEAGLNFEEPHGFAESGRAYLADSDGAELLFPYAAPGTSSGQIADHDPETVRGAILRLARESGAMNGPAKAALVPERIEGPVEIQSAHPSTFADVARRVWEEHRDSEELSAPASLSEESRLETVPEQMHSQPVAAPPSAAGQQPAASQPVVVEAMAAEVHSGCSFEDAALAHDACNLLSALGLYSDLLAFPGVLAEQHRHYAEELKLIAGRGQVLIDRMLKLTGTAAGREIPPAQQSGSNVGIHVTPRPVAVPAAAPAGSGGSPHGEALLIAHTDKVVEAATAEAQTAVAGGTQATSLVDLLMRWGSLLSTLAHGTLDVCFGPQAATPVPIEAEPLERILVNLVRNARAATVAGGAIRIGVGLSEAEPARSGQAIVLTVDDSGCGMTQSEINQILVAADGKCAESGTAIEQGESTRAAGAAQASPLASGPRQNQPGHAGDKRRRGLGLQVVKQLVGASGGRLTIQSRPGRGTRVEIRWPVAAAAMRAAVPVPVTRLDTAPPVAPETALRPSPMAAQPALESPSPQVAVGPDGFSEVELRAMMLRLHRQGPQPERAQKDSSLNGRSAPPYGPDRPGPVASPSGNGPAPIRFEAARSDVGRPEPDNYSAVKGAIAC